MNWNLTVLSLSEEIPQMAFDARRLMLSANQFVPNVMLCQSNIDGRCRRYFSPQPNHADAPSPPIHALQTQRKAKQRAQLINLIWKNTIHGEGSVQYIQMYQDLIHWNDEFEP